MSKRKASHDDEGEQKTKRHKVYNEQLEELKQDAPKKYILYFSRSKDKNAKYLSNFTPCEITYGGKTYPSVEHAYQAQKYAHLESKKSSEEMINRFTVSGDIGKQDARAAKSAGSGKGMKENKCTLDVKAWEEKQEMVMFALVEARMAKDERFREIVAKAVKNGEVLLHMERPKKQKKGQAPKAPYWGGYFPAADNKKKWIGKNRMGKIIEGCYLCVEFNQKA